MTAGESDREDGFGWVDGLGKEVGGEGEGAGVFEHWDWR